MIAYGIHKKWTGYKSLQYMPAVEIGCYLLAVKTTKAVVLRDIESKKIFNVKIWHCFYSHSPDVENYVSGK